MSDEGTANNIANGLKDEDSESLQTVNLKDDSGETSQSKAPRSFFDFVDDHFNKFIAAAVVLNVAAYATVVGGALLGMSAVVVAASGFGLIAVGAVLLAILAVSVYKKWKKESGYSQTSLGEDNSSQSYHEYDQPSRVSSNEFDNESQQQFDQTDEFVKDDTTVVSVTEVNGESTDSQTVQTTSHDRKAEGSASDSNSNVSGETTNLDIMQKENSDGNGKNDDQYPKDQDITDQSSNFSGSEDQLTDNNGQNGQTEKYVRYLVSGTDPLYNTDIDDYDVEDGLRGLGNNDNRFNESIHSNASRQNFRDDAKEARNVRDDEEGEVQVDQHRVDAPEDEQQVNVEQGKLASSKSSNQDASKKKNDGSAYSKLMNHEHGKPSIHLTKTTKTRVKMSQGKFDPDNTDVQAPGSPSKGSGSSHS